MKPGNLRVLADGQVKIMDFGVAKLLSETPSELTQTGTIVGTGHYMSPEQIQGLAIDQRSDIFSFGVVLYEILALRKPFDGETFTQVMYKIVHEKPVPLPAALQIPAALVTLVEPMPGEGAAKSAPRLRSGSPGPRIARRPARRGLGSPIRQRGLAADRGERPPAPRGKGRSGDHRARAGAGALPELAGDRAPARAGPPRGDGGGRNPGRR